MLWTKVISSVGITSSLVAASLVMTSCAHQSRTPVAAESLLNVSTEKVSFSIKNTATLPQIEKWIQYDYPTAAEISCEDDLYSCEQAKKMLEDYDILYRKTNPTSPNNRIALIYDRITANDCDTKDLGCSVTANVLQMTSDFRQYTHPALSGSPSASRAVNDIQDYRRK